MGLLTNLVASYSLGEASGNAIDNTANHLDLTAVNNPASASGKVGNCRYYNNAVPNYHYLANSLFSAGDQSWELSLWFYPGSIPTSGTGQQLISRDSDSTGREWFLMFIHDGTFPHLQMFLNTTGTYFLVNHPTNISTGGWNHISAYYDQPNHTIGIILNRGAPATTATSNAATSYPSTPLMIGARPYTGNQNYLNGYIDEVNYYVGRVLSSNDRDDLYDDYNGLPYSSFGKPDSPSTDMGVGLSGWWAMDEASGAALDSSINHQDAATTGTAPGATTPGKVNGCRTFNGTGGFAAPDSAVLSAGGTGFTVAGWFYTSAPASTASVINKGDNATAAGSETHLLLNGGTSRFGLTVYSGSSGYTVNANSFGAIVSVTWYFLCGFFDPVTGYLFLGVNQAYDATTALPSSLNDTTASMFFGQSATGTNRLNGRMDEWCFYKRRLHPWERRFLYNGGTGLSFSQAITQARISQIAVEVLRRGTPVVRDSQSVLEVLRGGLPVVRETQVVLEVLRSSLTIITVSSSGGASFGGAATAGLIFTAINAGGARLGGATATALTLSPPIGGGAALGGAASTAIVSASPAAGGAVLGGAAGTALTLAPSTGGGAVLGGSTAPPGNYTVTAGGGATLGASASGGIGFTLPAQGGVTLGASGSYGAVLVVSGGGGVTAGGAAPPAGLVYSDQTTGGVKAGGSAPAPAAFVPLTGGGAVTGASTTPSVTQAVSPPVSGGAVFGSSATGGVVWAGIATAGGVNTGGGALVGLTAAPPSAGGATTGGSASGRILYVSPAAGGAVLGGAGTERFATVLLVAYGGVTFGGSTFAGGAVVLPSHRARVRGLANTRPRVEAAAGNRPVINGRTGNRPRIAGHVMAITSDFELYEAEDAVLEVACDHNISAEQLRMDVRQLDDGTLMFSRLSSAGHISADPTDPTVALVLLPSAVIDIMPDVYYYSVARVDAGFHCEYANGRLFLRRSQVLGTSPAPTTIRDRRLARR